MNASEDQDDASHDLVEQVDCFIRRQRLIEPRAGVVVGVSGGADSVALLAVLRELAARPQNGYRLTVAHLNHQLRADAKDDEWFVADLAQQWDLPFAAASADVGREAQHAGLGIEETARKVRYDFLLRTARDAGAACVAVAHHRDDNVETVMQRIIRGTHLRGLAGMAASRPLADSVRLVRPMLDVTRCQVEEFLRSAGISWRTDTSNADTQYRRNFIRHELLPLAKERLNMRADEAILRLASAAWQVEEFLTELAKEAIDSARLAGANAQITRMSRTGTGCDPTSGASFDCAVLAGLRDVVLGYALRLALEHSGVPLREVGAKRIEDLQAIVRAGAGAIDLPAGFRARCEGGMFVIVRQERHADAAAQSRPAGAAKPCDGAMADLAPARDVPLGCPGVASLPGGARISCRRQPITPEEFAEHCRVHPQGREWLDAEQVRGPLLCRPVRADDAFWPLGASCRRSVREFLKKQHRTAGNRQETFCICDELGVIFVAPLRIDSRVRVTPGTREVMVLETCQPSIP